MTDTVGRAARAGRESGRSRDRTGANDLTPKRWPRWLWSRFEQRPDTSAAPRTSSGLPSHAALIAAAGELEDRSMVLRQPVAVVRLRLAGVAQLREDELSDIARLVEGPLPPYARLYEESRGDLVLLLPAADAGDAIRVAARIKSEVSASAQGGDGGVRILAGISASHAGEPFVFEWVRAKAEQALEEAERQGGLAVAPSLQSENYGKGRGQ